MPVKENMTKSAQQASGSMKAKRLILEQFEISESIKQFCVSIEYE